METKKQTTGDPQKGSHLRSEGKEAVPASGQSPTMSVNSLYLPAKEWPEEGAVKETENTEKNLPSQCLLCDQSFPDVDRDAEPLRAHLVTDHKFVVADIKLVVDMKGYLEYWRRKLRHSDADSLKAICTVIKTNCAPTDTEPSEEYYMLSPDSLPEDKELRQRLSNKRLEKVLGQQQLERKDISFKRQCLFCKKKVSGNRVHILDHLAHDHNFTFGLPDNLVYVSELLDLIEEKLNRRLCLFCEKVFKDWDTLKEHMRKKQHKRLNPENPEYDRFYLINYLEPGKNWRDFPDSKSDRRAGIGGRGWRERNEEQEEWDDWVEDEATLSFVCLFCSLITEGFDILSLHMKDVHFFDMQSLESWPFYKKVKLINFIRSEAHFKRCFFCQTTFSSSNLLVDHLKESIHSSLVPPDSLWDLPHFYFPTYENDSLLLNLHENEDQDEKTDESVTVIPEDLAPSDENLQLQDLLISGSSHFFS